MAGLEKRPKKKLKQYSFLWKLVTFASQGGLYSHVL